ncbi:MAG TPA: hypothetical protein VHA33_03595, partial [Candidatus Angelobacter sp.]|nr:hypothetical protein [Candidatus Angelobacter sp.]
MRRWFGKASIWMVFLALVLAACFGYLHFIFQESPEQQLSAVEKQINEHYRKYRAFQYRWSGAPYAPMRGPLTTDDQNTAQKTLKITLGDLDRAEHSLGPSVRSIKLRGRIELLSGDYDHAVQHYLQAIQQAPIDSNLQLELGIGFALQAQRDDRALDYEHSMEAMLEAARQSQAPEALFDIALLFTEFPLPGKAIDCWQKMLSLETSEGWTREAQKQLSILKQMQDVRQRHIQELTASAESYLAHATPADAALELVVDEAIENWLPLAASSGPNRAALEHLAAALKTARQDQWLSDMLKAPSSPDNSAALKLLG